MVNAWRARRRLGVGGLDQIVSAASNLLLTVVVGRVGGFDALGSWSLAYAGILIVQALVRATLSEPALTEPLRPEGEHRMAPYGAVPLAAALGVVGGGAAALMGLLLGQPLLVVVGAVLPGILIQDGLRYEAFRRRRPGIALYSDTTWLLALLVVSALALVGPDWAQNPLLPVGGWGLGAYLGAGLAWALLGAPRTTLACAMGWWTTSGKRVGIPLLGESSLQLLSGQVMWLAFGALVSSAALGTLRATQVIFAPVQLLSLGVASTAVPEIAGRWESVRSRDLRRWAFMAVALGVSAAVATWMLFPLLSAVLFGTRLEPEPAMLLAVALVAAGTPVGMLASAVLKAARSPVLLVWSRGVSAVVAVALLAPLVVPFGISGAAWLMLLASWSFTVTAWVLLWRFRRRTSELAQSA